jgi:hypothetical protein
MTDLGMVAWLDNGQGMGNEHGVHTDDVQAADRGRWRGFGNALGDGQHAESKWGKGGRSASKGP